MKYVALFATFTALTLAASEARAQLIYISADRTVAGGNPLNGVYNGNRVIVGASGFNSGTGQFIRVPNVQADAVDPASFGYSDQTGGGLEAWSNSLLRVSGGTFQVTGGTGAPGGGVSAYDTSQVTITGGTILATSVSGAAAGAGGATMTVSGGTISNGQGIVAAVRNGILNVNAGATIRSTGNGQPAISGDTGSIVNVSGGTVAATTASGDLGGINIGAGSALSVTGGTISGSANNPNGVIVNNATVTAALTGGSIAGVQARRSTFNLGTSVATQVRIGGNVAISNGVFAFGEAAVDVTGGTFTNYGGVTGAAFVTLGNNNINFFGTSLVLSAPTPGSLVYVGSYTGNYYTFTSGTFADGQSAVGLRLFDATGTGASGGFTVTSVGSTAPEPSTLALISFAALGLIARRRKNH